MNLVIFIISVVVFLICTITLAWLVVDKIKSNRAQKKIFEANQDLIHPEIRHLADEYQMRVNSGVLHKKTFKNMV
jgi:hypothetical protein